ncbi:ester cyclase [Halovivax gelatinilyticus]|uniref:ester cyclase n=1 Tax=Halovivax gelatinilyticus TaxID=2961597 RepID=UPI0020CA7794|nr:ester cyclase [Halovivax gelatinilyticus]
MAQSRRETDQLKDEMSSLAERVWNDGDVDAIDDRFAHDFVRHTPESLPDIHGPEAYKERVRELRSAFPDFEIDIERTVADDELLLTHLTISGTHDGEFMGIEPTGESIDVPVMSLMRLEDDRVAEEWLLSDSMEMMVQLGVAAYPDEV